MGIKGVNSTGQIRPLFFPPTSPTPSRPPTTFGTLGIIYCLTESPHCQRLFSFVFEPLRNLIAEHLSGIIPSSVGHLPASSRGQRNSYPDLSDALCNRKRGLFVSLPEGRALSKFLTVNHLPTASVFMPPKPVFSSHSALLSPTISARTPRPTSSQELARPGRLKHRISAAPFR